MGKKTILIVDGDLIAYRMAAVCDKRWIDVKYCHSNETKRFDNRTELKAFLKKEDLDQNLNNYTITDGVDTQDATVAFKLVKNRIEALEEVCWADKTEIYLGEGKVFRHDLELPEAYKGNREDLVKPTHFHAVRAYMQKVLGARMVKGIETDDQITIRAYEELAKGNIPVVATIDKDAYQCQDVMIMDWLNDPIKVEKIPKVGKLRKIPKIGIKGTGLKFLAYQVLAGDPVDTYKPYFLSKVSYGPTKAYDVLKDLDSEKEILQKVIQQYKMLYPEATTYIDVHGNQQTKDWKAILEMYWKCAYMKRSKDDPSSVYEFFKSKGVNLEEYQ